MKYVSIDLETTGLNPDNCQILEVAAVYNDDALPLALCPIFHRYIWHEVVKGEHYALTMNAELIKEIYDEHRAKCNEVIAPDTLQYHFRDWLIEHEYPTTMNDDGLSVVKNVVVAGKNFASFDTHFLAKYEVHDLVKFHHRVIDPTMYYHEKDDVTPPDTVNCMLRSGLQTGPMTHRAIDDAKNVIALVRTHFGVPL